MTDLKAESLILISTPTRITEKEIKHKRERAAVRKMLGATGLKISCSGFLLSAYEVDVFFLVSELRNE